jgi:hypothetical protein
MTYPALKATAFWCIQNNVDIPVDILHAMADIFKTVDWYNRAMWAAVRDLYNGVISVPEFETIMIDIIQNQLRRAWNEGMRSIGLDPESDMTLLWEMALQDIMASELVYVDPLAAEIVAAFHNNENVDQFRSRVELWANRYNDVVNQAVQICSKAGQKMEWIYGDTAHCTTCEQLNGTVAFESEWEQAGIYPQRPPNAMLSCGGWKCQCQIVPTDKRRSPNALEKLLAIGLGD